MNAKKIVGYISSGLKNVINYILKLVSKMKSNYSPIVISGPSGAGKSELLIFRKCAPSGC